MLLFTRISKLTVRISDLSCKAVQLHLAPIQQAPVCITKVILTEVLGVSVVVFYLYLNNIGNDYYKLMTSQRLSVVVVSY